VSLSSSITYYSMLIHCFYPFSTLKRVRECSSLSTILNRAQPLRTRIESWRQSVPLLSKQTSDLNEEDLEAGAALRLSHLTLETLIFRALLRPLFYQAISAVEANQEPISTIFDNCYACAKLGTELVSSFQAKHFSNFWAPCELNFIFPLLFPVVDIFGIMQMYGFSYVTFQALS
jgi:hypothetical protein